MGVATSHFDGPPGFEWRGSLESGFHRSGFGRQLLGIGGRGQAAQDLLRSLLVVFPSPGLDLGAGVQQRREPVLVEAFVAQAAVEALDVGVLVRLAWLDQAQLNTALVRPRHHRLAAELLAVVSADHLWQTPCQRQPIQHPRYAVAGDGPLHLDRHRLVCGIVDDGQGLEHPALGGAVEHEVHRPDLVGRFDLPPVFRASLT